VVEWLRPRPGDTIVDGTLGGGGHARALAERVGPDGLVIALDRDPAAVEGTEAEKYRAFVDVASQIARRVELFCAFPDDKLAAFRVADLNAIAHEGRPATEEAPAR
jgi:16S rRNA C1402 N4-methylase RsmH